MLNNKSVQSSRPTAQLKTPSSTTAEPLSRDAVIELFDYVEEGLAITGCDHSFRCTEAFLMVNDITMEPALNWLRRHGAGCDCEVLEEVAQRWLSSAQDVS